VLMYTALKIKSKYMACGYSNGEIFKI